MVIIYNSSAGVLSEMARTRLRGIFSQGSDKAVERLKELFPRQTVSARLDHIQVTKKDGTVIVDLVNDGTGKVQWTESKVNLRMSVR